MSTRLNNEFKKLVSENFHDDAYVSDEEEIMELEVDPTEVGDTVIGFAGEIQPDPAIMNGIKPHADNDDVITADLVRAQESAAKLASICATTEADNWMIAKIAKATDYIDEVLKRMEVKATNDCGCE